MIFVLKQENQELFIIILWNYFTVRQINICSRNVTFKHIDSEYNQNVHFDRAKNS